MLIRRLVTVAAAASATVALTMGSAAAHFCYVENANENGQKGKSNSPAFLSFSEVVAIFVDPTLCPDGVAVLADAADVTPDTAIFQPRTLPDTAGISHLNVPAIEGAYGDAVEACGTE